MSQLTKRCIFSILSVNHEGSKSGVFFLRYFDDRFLYGIRRLNSLLSLPESPRKTLKAQTPFSTIAERQNAGVLCASMHARHACRMSLSVPQRRRLSFRSTAALEKTLGRSSRPLHITHHDVPESYHTCILRSSMYTAVVQYPVGVKPVSKPVVFRRPKDGEPLASTPVNSRAWGVYQKLRRWLRILWVYVRTSCLCLLVCLEDVPSGAQEYH